MFFMAFFHHTTRPNIVRYLQQIAALVKNGYYLSTKSAAVVSALPSERYISNYLRVISLMVLQLA